MKSLIRKDFYLIARYFRLLVVLVALFLVMYVMDGDLFFLVYPALIGGVVPVSLTSYDERDKWNQYSLTMPYTRDQLVTAKYVVGLLVSAVPFVLTLIACVVRMQMQGAFDPAELLTTALLLVLLSLIGPTLVLPFLFRFGAEKGRVAFYVMIGLLCGIGGLLSVQGYTTVVDFSKLGVLALVCAGLVLVYLVSWRLSVSFYRQREF